MNSPFNSLLLRHHIMFFTDHLSVPIFSRYLQEIAINTQWKNMLWRIQSSPVIFVSSPRPGIVTYRYVQSFMVAGKVCSLIFKVTTQLKRTQNFIPSLFPLTNSNRAFLNYCVTSSFSKIKKFIYLSFSFIRCKTFSNNLKFCNV